MKKIISVNSPTGTNEYELVSAFDSYIVLDSAKKDANGFTIVYVSKDENGTLLYVEGEEWDLAKKNLIAAVKNDGVTWKEVNDSYEAGEMIGHQISLKDDNLQALKDNYVVVPDYDVENLDDEENNIEEQAQSELDIPVINGVTPVEEENNVENQVQNELDAPVANESDTVEEIKEETPVNNLENSIANVDMTSPIDIISQEDANQTEISQEEIPSIEPVAIENGPEDTITDGIPDAQEQVAISERPIIQETPIQENIPQEIPEQNLQGEGQPIQMEPEVEVQAAVPGEIPVETEQVSQIVPEQQVMPEQNIMPEVPVQDAISTEMPIEPEQQVMTEQTVTPEVPVQNIVSAEANSIDQLINLNNNIYAMVSEIKNNLGVSSAVSDAQVQAQQIIANAQAQAQQIIADATKKSTEIIETANAKLEVANKAFENSQTLMQQAPQTVPVAPVAPATIGVQPTIQENGPARTLQA
ncbi:MAG: hypothetical protein E7158_04765 [Firmicutes bacterium]|nr:hypothetical protein [Bacillota bacterium]